MPGPDQQRLLFNLAARIGQLPFAPVEVTAGPPASTTCPPPALNDHHSADGRLHLVLTFTCAPLDLIPDCTTVCAFNYWRFN